MKILYDHLCFKAKYGGVSKYFIQLIDNLPPEIQWQISVKYTNNEYIHKHNNNIKTKEILKDISFRGKERLISMINKRYSVHALKNGNYDIYHQTHYDPYGYKYLAKDKKSITTIYDMNFFKIPHCYKNDLFFKMMVKNQEESAKKANKIITISKNTMNDIMEIWNIPASRIELIYLGIERKDLNEYNKDRLYSSPYILFVGGRIYHKNFVNYLKTFSTISKKYPDLLLVCTGYPFSNHEKKIIQELKLTNKVFQIFASEELMVNLYYNAELFVYPSFYEGFGMPLLEAMNCNCPVICSNTSCFPEIAKDAALYFDPYDIDSMINTTEKALIDKETQKMLVANGAKLLNEKIFSWEKCAAEHIRVYKDLINV
jgi:glycosyltransferase involved in cell wall biosynthesis